MNLPTPQQLRYLVALAEHGHFGRAADACAVTQSTLSAGVLAMERQLDARILDRDIGKQVAFTPLGRDVLRRARVALTALEAVAEAAAADRAPLAGPLRLGVIPTIGPFMLPRLMPVLRDRFPSLKLYLREDLTEKLLDQLRGDRLDLLLLALPYACGPDIETLPLGRDEFLLAMQPDHPLAAKPRVPETALASEKLLLLEDGHCLRDQVLTACPTLQSAKTPPDAFAATSLHTLVQMVAGGLGVTLLPRLAVSGGITDGTDLQLRRLTGRGSARMLGLAWRKDAPRAGDYRALAPLLTGIIPT